MKAQPSSHTTGVEPFSIGRYARHSAIERVIKAPPLSSTKEGCCAMCGHELPESKIIVDLNSNILAWENTIIQLRPRDAEVLKVLHSASPRFLSARQIEDRVLGTESNERSLEWVRVRMSLLRKMIKGSPLEIQNRHGVGYRLIERRI